MQYFKTTWSVQRAVDLMFSLTVVSELFELAPADICVHSALLLPFSVTNCQSSGNSVVCNILIQIREWVLYFP